MNIVLRGVFELNFNVVESNFDDFYCDLDKFVELYNDDNILIKDIKQELGLTTNKYNDYLEKACSDGSVVRRHRVAKYYYYSDGAFHIAKRDDDGVMINYGRFPTEDMAKYVVCELKKVNWDKSYVDNIREDYLSL